MVELPNRFVAAPASPATSTQARARWGQETIAGPKHLYREGLMLDLVRRAGVRGWALDVGCGTGSMALRLAGLGFTVWGVDSSADCVGKTRAALRQKGPASSGGVVLAGAEDLPFAGGSFDLVTCGEVLEHVPDDRLATSEIARVLRPGGVCAITVPADQSRWTSSDEWAGHRRRYSPEGLRHLFEGAGLEVLVLRRWGFPIVALYDRLAFYPYMRRQSRADSGGKCVDLAGKLGRNNAVSWFLARIFAIDGLLPGPGRGGGLLLLARLVR